MLGVNCYIFLSRMLLHCDLFYFCLFPIQWKNVHQQWSSGVDRDWPWRLDAIENLNFSCRIQTQLHLWPLIKMILQPFSYLFFKNKIMETAVRNCKSTYIQKSILLIFILFRNIKSGEQLFFAQSFNFDQTYLNTGLKLKMWKS